MNDIAEIATEILLLSRQLASVQAEQAKLIEKEGAIRTKMQHLEIKRQRLADLESREDGE